LRNSAIRLKAKMAEMPTASELKKLKDLARTQTDTESAVGDSQLQLLASKTATRGKTETLKRINTLEKKMEELSTLLRELLENILPRLERLEIDDES
jgi:hypothetical protein